MSVVFSKTLEEPLSKKGEGSAPSIAPLTVPLHLSEHAWVRQFDCRHIKPLIVCRGPVRLEAIEVFRAMGLPKIGMLLSDKDSTVFEDARSPESFLLPPDCVHRIEDYQANATAAQRQQQIDRIIDIANTAGYNAIFAGYGFMAEASDFVQAVTTAGLLFIGPGASVVAKAGQKDDAKTLARSVGVRTTPGVDNLTARALVRQMGARAALISALSDLSNVQNADNLEDHTDEAFAQILLDSAQQVGKNVLQFDVLVAQAIEEIERLRQTYPGRTLRFKAVGGGGGKGQRLLPPDIASERLGQWLPEVLRSVLNEAGSDAQQLQNILIELNIEQSRHQEIQLVGNGQWCVALGGRDCSVQWQEQKLLELSITTQELEALIADCNANDAALKAALQQQAQLLEAMEQDAESFGRALGLDSVSTFECLVSENDYAFMELNARLQVEHRVTEQCYALEFTHSEDSAQTFRCQSLIEIMVLLAAHGPALPPPKRVALSPAAAEVRINATDAALAPHVGGRIRFWSWSENGAALWDDQGIAHRVSNQSMSYHLAGAYDSNIALLIVRGETRKTCLEKLNLALSDMRLEGEKLETNASFHRGLISWLMHQALYPQVGTKICAQHLQAVVQVAQPISGLEADALFKAWVECFLACVDPEQKTQWHATCETLRGLAVAPLKLFLSDPHLFYGWLSLTDHWVAPVTQLQSAVRSYGCVQSLWRYMPSIWLKETLRFSGLYSQPLGRGLWPEDQALCVEIEQFYAQLSVFLSEHDICQNNARDSWDLFNLFKTAPKGVDANLWASITSAHATYSIMFGFWQWALVWGCQADWPKLSLNPTEELHHTRYSLEADALNRARRLLSPPPQGLPNEIVAPSGGLFYAQPAPGEPPFIQAGDHFVRGQTLCIIEVMKMFNPVKAEFDGTIEAVLIEGDQGAVVQKGQTLFSIKNQQIESDLNQPERSFDARDAEQSIHSWFES